MTIKRIVRFPFLVVFYIAKIAHAFFFALSIAMIGALFRWVMVDEATAKEACLYWWHSILFVWYPLSSDECDISWYVIRDLDERWGTR